MAAGQQNLSSLLQWSIANSSAPEADAANGESTTNGDAPVAPPRDPNPGLNADMLAQLLGGPSDADRMRDAMTAIVLPLDQVNLENKLIAWDNLEQLIEQIDNANNLEALGMWPPLLEQLGNEEGEMRRMAAWCVSTAVQNNVKSQERLLAKGGIPRLAKLATEDPVQSVRKKAISALSSAVRNFQPGLDEVETALPDSLWTRKQGLDAADMAAVDEVIQVLRDHSAARAAA